MDLEKAIPSSWFTSEKIYNLERRAIFSREWLLISHKCRFTEVGRWLQFDIAGYPIVVVRDRSGNINAFHNVCRHRAYNVVDGDQGKASILACKYHGWSYGLNGKLAKAPGYQDLSGFQKERNGLFSVHTKIDSKGFVWINLDGKEEPEVTWKDDNASADVGLQSSSIDFDDLQYVQSQSSSATVNWKLAVDAQDLICKEAEGTATIICGPRFPNSCIITLGGLVLTRKVFPQGIGKASIWYNVFRGKEAPIEDSGTLDKLLTHALAKDKDLASSQPKKSNSSVSTTGLPSELDLDSSPIWKRVHKAVAQHHEREQSQGKEIWPAQKSAFSNDQDTLDNTLFCSKLDKRSCGNMGTIKDIEALF